MEFWIFWIGINALIGYAIGKQKNEVGGAIAISILLGPIGWIIAMLSRGNLRKCPFCAEGVKLEAKVCRYCHRELPPRSVQPKPVLPPLPTPYRKLNPSKPTSPLKVALWLSAVCVAAMAALITLAFSIGPEKKHQSNGSQASQRDSDANASLQPVSSPADTPQQTYYWSLTLTKPVELKDSVGRLVAKLESGQSVQYIGSDNYVARIRYDGTDYEIPLSSTDLK